MTLLRLAAFVVLAFFALPAAAQELTDEQAAEAMDFAMHDAVFTLYHETGHLLVHELGLPVLGKEEDAADALAVILILKTTADGDEMFNTLIDTADGWYFSAEDTTGEGVDDLSYYDDHSLDIQRAYAMVCMMVGADPKEFGETADIYEMDKDRQDQCAGVYEQSLQSWMQVLDPHFATAAGAEIPVTYEDPGDYVQFADELKSRKVLENLAEFLRTNFTLPGPVSVRGAQCGQANAFYSPDDHQITYCYELAAQMYQLDATKGFGPDSADEPAVDEGPAAASAIPDDAHKIAGSKGG
ncbi:MAG: DUF4344 domain-containing metallopeptidase [Devosia sp.]|nr:DUF4344 domain-containing metallopeptidase [Devosia sp.]